MRRKRMKKTPLQTYTDDAEGLDKARVHIASGDLEKAREVLDGMISAGVPDPER